MQLMEHWPGNVAKFAQHNKSGGCVLNSLQLINMALRHTIIIL